MGNGRVLEARIRNGGKIFSRHYESVSPEQARRKAQRLGKVISIRKFNPWDIMGTYEVRDKSITEILGISAGRMERVEQEVDLLSGDVSIEDVLFPKRKKERGQGRQRY